MRRFLIATLVALFALLPSQPALANSQETAAMSGEVKNPPKSDGGPFCSILVGKAPEDGGNSPVLARSCSNTSIDETTKTIQAEYQKRRGFTGKHTASTAARLMTWYQHRNFNDFGEQDGALTHIYGYDGPCDSSGYRVEPTDWWKNSLSSIFGNTHCDYARVHNIALNDAYNFYIYSRTGANFMGHKDNNAGLVEPHNG